jgi:EAL domain-containing protein (putative c-di-GMP-specific phosphodiesterase class I)/GGDEF domain-containing protein
MIFTGNFIISIKNTKEYLEIESVTKAQDTATSLGLTLQPLMKNKNDSEIDLVIKAIANRGFYKEIRVEDIGFTFSNMQLIENSKDINGAYWHISDVRVDPKYGELSSSMDDLKLSNELSNLEDDTKNVFEPTDDYMDVVYLLIPSKNLKDNDKIKIDFTAKQDNKTIKTSAILTYTKILAKQTRDVKFDSVPQWFINMIPINLPEKSSDISDGWRTTAILYVSANPGVAYEKLYEQAKGALVYAIIAFMISILFTVLFLRRVLKPLKQIEQLAIDISNGEFKTIKKLPWTKELRSVSYAMNDMSSKIESMINKLNKNLEKMSNKLSTDELTGLGIKQSFDTDMKNMFINKQTGYVVSIKIDDLASYAKYNDASLVDKFLKDFSNILKNCDKNATAYRFFGSEFALIVKNVNQNEIQMIIANLQKELEDFSKKVDKLNIAHIGAALFNPYGTTASILSRSNEAYEKAKQIGPNAAYIRDDEDEAKDMTQWKELVFDIIDNNKFDIVYIADAYTLDETKKLVMQEAFTSAKDKNNKAIPIGTFISIAEKYDKIIDFDKSVIQKVIQYINSNKISHEISINISLDSLCDNMFQQWLYSIIKKNKLIASQLVFSVTSYGVAKDTEQFKNFIDLLHSVGAKIIIKRFESKFVPMNTIKEFKLDYIRLARDYTNDIKSDNTKYGFVESIQDLATLLNIKIFAENVKNDKDYEIIKEIGLYGASR